MYLERRYVGSPSAWGFITDSYALAAQAAFTLGKSRPIGKVAFTASIVFRTFRPYDETTQRALSFTLSRATRSCRRLQRTESLY